MAPQWAQDAEWKTAELITACSVRIALVVGRFLGLKDGYGEYYRATARDTKDYHMPS